MVPREREERVERETGGIPNNRLFLPYAAPYFAYVTIASLLSSRVSVEISYALRLLFVPALLVWAWRWYPKLTGPRSAVGSTLAGAIVGLLGATLWIVLLSPSSASSAKPWSDLGFALRLTAAGAVVPLFEELFIRGFVLRLGYQWDHARREGARDPFATAWEERSVSDVPPGGWTVTAVAVSTAAFGLGHQVREWPAAVAFGLLMSGLWIWRKDLLSCVVAHGVANVALATFVRASGQWGIW